MIASPDTPLDTFLSQPNALLPITADTQDTLHAQAGGAADHLIDIDLGEAADKETLFSAFARAFDMPRWFGHNWDALEDCLTDLDWLPHGSVLVRITGRTASIDDARMLATVLESACDAWQADDRRFHVLIEAALLTG